MTVRTIRLNAKLENESDNKSLLVARDDLRLAANRTITRLYLGETKQGESQHTAAYRIVSGIAGHEPAAYQPTDGGNVLCGGARSALATLVHDRFKKDAKDIETGKKSLATFRRIPVLVRQSEVKVLGNEYVELGIYGKPNPRRLKFKVWPAGRRQRATWRAIVLGTLRYGDARLQTDRLGRWYILLSHHAMVEESKPDGIIVCADVRAGTLKALCAGVGDSLEKDAERQDFPPSANFWRLWEQDLATRRAIGLTNRLEYELREGRGRQHKLEPIYRRRERYRLRVEDMCHCMARALVNWAKKQEANRIVLWNPVGKVQLQQDATEDTHPRKTRAEMRARFLREQRTKLSDLIKQKAELAGIVVEIYTLKKEEIEASQSDRLMALARKAFEKNSAVEPGRCTGAGEDVRAVASPKGEIGESRAASGEMIADSRQALERSPRSGVKSSDRLESQGSGDISNRDVRNATRKHRRNRRIELPGSQRVKEI